MLYCSHIQYSSLKSCISRYCISPSFLKDPGCICQGWQTPPPSSPRCPQHMLPPPASELQLSAVWRRCCCLPQANWPIHLAQAGSSYCDVDESVMQGPMSEPVFFLRSWHTPQIHEPLRKEIWNMGSLHIQTKNNVSNPDRTLFWCGFILGADHCGYVKRIEAGNSSTNEINKFIEQIATGKS